MLQTLKALPRTFFSRAYYRDLVIGGRGIGFGFIVLMILFNLIGGGLRAWTPLSALAKQVNAAFRAMPEVTIEHGRLSIRETVPYTVPFYKDEDSDINVVFDTSFDNPNVGAVARAMAKDKAIVLVAADRYFVADRQGGLRTYSLQTAKDMKLTQEDWEKIRQKLALWIPVLGGMFVVLMLLVWNMFLVLAGELVALLLAPAFKIKSSMASAMRLTAAANMPVAVLMMAVLLPTFVGLVIWFGTCLFGLWAASAGHDSAKGQTL